MSNVLSLFDGLSGARLALDRAGVKCDRYYASEIDRHAIKVSSANFPDTIHLGDVEKWQEWNLPQIDILIFGSPCTGFSFAGKGLNFEDPQSRLFFTAADIKNKLQADNPNLIFLMENVQMKSEHREVISDTLGVDPILIDAARVSAQTRKRNFWTNIITHGQPKDKGIYLKDILQPEGEVGGKYYLSEKVIASFQKHAERNKEKGNNFGWNVRTIVQKAATIPTASDKSTSTFDESGRIKATAVLAQSPNNKMANFNEIRHLVETEVVTHSLQPRQGKGQGGKGHLSKTDGKSYACDTANGQAVETFAHCVAMRGRNIVDGKRKDYKGAPTEQRLELNPNGKTNTITGVQKDNLVFLSEPEHVHGEPRIYEDKSPTLQSRMGTGGNNVPYVNNIRRLTEIEVCRLFTVPDDYFLNEDGSRIISSSQTYKCLGNGWVIDVVAWILAQIPNGASSVRRQGKLF